VKGCQGELSGRGFLGKTALFSRTPTPLLRRERSLGPQQEALSPLLPTREKGPEDAGRQTAANASALPFVLQ
jgi:hypothetical protein